MNATQTRLSRRHFALLSALAVLSAAQPAQADDVSRGLAALKREPSVGDVQQAALRYFRVNSSSINSFRRGAAWKGLVPVFEMSGGYVYSGVKDDTIDRAFDPDAPWVLRGVSGNAVDVRGKATFNLPQVMFNPEELDVASLAGLVEGILKESTRLYYMRRRLQVDMLLTPPTDRATRLTKELRLEELTALLDAMTGGWFQQALDEGGYDDERASLSAPSTPAQRAVQRASAQRSRVGQAPAPASLPKE